MARTTTNAPRRNGRRSPLGRRRPHRHRPADHRRRLRRLLRRDGATGRDPGDVRAHRRGRQEALPGQLRHLPRPQPAGHRGRPVPVRRRRARRRVPGRRPAACRCRRRARRRRRSRCSSPRSRSARSPRTCRRSAPGPPSRTRSTSTARATSPAAPSCSASTARCATTSPAPAARSPRASTRPRSTRRSALHMYAAMVTGPQNMPVFNDMNLTPEDKRDIISRPALPAGERVARRLRARLARPRLGGPVHLDLRHRRARSPSPCGSRRSPTDRTHRQRNARTRSSMAHEDDPLRAREGFVEAFRRGSRSRSPTRCENPGLPPHRERMTDKDPTR